MIRRNKTAIAVVSAIAMAAQMVPVTVFADTDGSGILKISSSDITLVKVAENSTGTVEVSFTNNPGFMNATFEIVVSDGVTFETPVVNTDKFAPISAPINNRFSLDAMSDVDYEGVAFAIPVTVANSVADGTFTLEVRPVEVYKEDGVTDLVGESRTSVVKKSTITKGEASAKSTDATLKSFKAGTETITTTADKYDYEVTVPSDTTSVPAITDVVKNDSKAGTPDISNGTAFTDGKAVSTIKVTAEDGTTTKTYTVTYKLAAKSTDATLKSFKAGTETITTTADKYEYDVEVPYGTTTVPAITNPVTTDSKATVGTPEGDTAFTDGKAVKTIKVTAEDGTTTQTYKVTYKWAEQTKISDVVESVSIGSDATVGTKLTPQITYKTGKSASDLGNISYTWNNISGTANADNSYTVAAGDVGKKLSVTVKGDKVSGEVKSNEAEAGKSKFAAPTKLELDTQNNGDKTTVTATATGTVAEGTFEYNFRVNNYATLETPDKWTDWSSTNTYNANPGDTVYAFVRYKATEASDASDYLTESVKIKNNKAEFASIGPEGTDAVMNPAFSTDETTYEVRLPYGSSVPAYPLQYQIAADSIGATVSPESLSFTTLGNHEVTITSEDGTVSKKYTFNYVEAKRAVADLKINFNGDEGLQQIQFNPTTKEYNVILPSDATDDTVKNYKLEWTLNDGATVKDSKQATGLTEGNNKAYVTVSCDGIDTTYTVTFTKQPVILSSDATLKSLTVQGYAIPFVPTQNSYTVNLPAGTTIAPIIYGVKNHEKAEITSIVPGGNLVNGRAVASITVKAEDGRTNTYQVVFVSEVLSNDTALIALVPSIGTMSPSFSPSVYSYTVVLPAGTTYVPTFSYVKRDANQVVTVNNAANVNGTTYVTVKAPSGNTTSTYRINFRVSGSTVDSGTITVQPTCTKTGTRVYRDIVTGQIIRTETIPALGHNWGSGVVTSSATATSTGTITYTCTRCGEHKYETIPATGTSYNYYYDYTPVTRRVNYVEPSSNGIDNSRATITIDPVEIDRLTSVRFKEKGKGSYVLKWSRVIGVTNYEVYIGKNGDLKKVKNTSATSLKLKGLKNNTTYDVQIKYTFEGVQHTINGSTFVYYKPAVKAESTSNTVTLKWNRVEGAEKYAVYQVVNGKYKKVSETTKSAVKIGKRKSGTEYKYAVRAYVDGSWTGIAKSDVVTVTTK